MDIKKLIAVATGEIAHDNAGLCPDMVAGYDSRDPECLACQIIVEAERAALEKQEPVGYQELFNAIAAATDNPYPGAVGVSVKAFTEKIGPLFTAPADMVNRAFQDGINSGYAQAMMDEMARHRQAEQADAHTDCAGAQHARQQEAAALVGLNGCNSRHGTHWGEDGGPCIYRMRSTDPGCTGCADRDEDQSAEAEQK